MTIDREIFNSVDNHNLLVSRLAVLTHLFADAGPGVSARADFGDGTRDESADIAFSSTCETTHLVPDSDFFNSHSYAHVRDMVPALPRWNERSGDIVWRGATTGFACVGSAIGRDPGILDLQRVRLCMVLRDDPTVDAKIYAVVQSRSPDQDRERLIAEGVMGDRVPEQEWRNRQFAFDIDGNSNAWSNLFVRLLFGCCVIKVASPANFRQWYYDRLVPFRHYVPVAADLHDLHETIAWCRSHDGECRAIALEGQRLALSLTFEGEMTAASARIRERFGGNLSAPKSKALRA